MWVKYQALSFEELRRENVEVGFRDAEHTSLRFFYLLLPPLRTWERERKKKKEKKNNQDCEKTLKNQPPGQTPAGHTCQSKRSQRDSLKDDFLFADDIRDRTITHLSPGCAKNYQQDICQGVWDIVALIHVRMRHWEKARTIPRNQERKGIRSFKFDFRQTPIWEPYLSPWWLLL